MNSFTNQLEMNSPTACPSRIMLQPLPDCFRQQVLKINKPATMSAIDDHEPTDFWGSLIVQASGSRQVRPFRVVSYIINNRAAPTPGSAAQVVVDTNPKPRRTCMTA